AQEARGGRRFGAISFLPVHWIKQPAAWRCWPGSGGRWTRSWSWARRSSRSTTPASSSSSDVATLLRLAFVNSDTESFLFPFPGLRVLMRKILLFAMGPGRWQALTCVRRCNSHTSTLPTHAIISGAKMIWCLQRFGCTCTVLIVHEIHQPAIAATNQNLL
uniref:Uncharacterized protein n=1 Tax=Triticum urartu TaxID=4572 RepID=A0A8R7Q3V3_TRIUA